MKCTECPKYKTCTELCEEAEAYANKDYGRLKEIRAADLGINIENIYIELFDTVDPLTTGDWLYLMRLQPDLTSLQKRYVYLHYWRRLSYSKIGEMYGSTKSNIHSIILAAKSKINIYQ